MTRTNLIARSLNDLGAAAWFGGVLMEAVAVNRAVADVADPTDRGAAAANEIRRRWWPVSTVAIGSHLVGGALLTLGNRERVVAQRGVASLSVGRSAFTVAAVATAAYSGRLGKRIADAEAVVARAGSTPGDATPPEVASAMDQRRILQWALPALTGLLVVLNAAQGEQQRPAQVVRGVLRRLNPAA